MLCATIKNNPEKEILRANRSADLIELNLAHFKKENPLNLRSLCKKPVIFKLQQIDWDLLALLPDFVDLPHSVEASDFAKIEQKYPTIKRICSYHDFNHPGDLEVIWNLLSSRPADIYKIATLAHSTLDALKMLQLVKRHRCLGISMGENGVITRILSGLFSAPWTYAPLSESQRTAPGQLLLKELKTIYYHSTRSPQTALYGLIGDPITNSPSHRMHNWAFKKLGLDAVYVKMRITKEEVGPCLSLCQELGFKGLSVTMPLKETVCGFIPHSHSQTINTLCFKDNTIRGWNTDGPGALNVLEKREKVEGKKIVVLGAGGAAWGIAMEARQRGASLTILNRTLEKGLKLARVVGGQAFVITDFARVAQQGYDILINCTSVGMGDDPHTPIPANELLEQKIVMDIISRPQVTPLLAAAKKKGCCVIEGMEMFIQQAIGQYCHWFENHLV